MSWKRILENSIVIIMSCIPIYILIGAILFIGNNYKIQQEMEYKSAYEERLDNLESNFITHKHTKNGKIK